MTQIILNVEDQSMLPGLRKILGNLNGVTLPLCLKSVRVHCLVL